MHAGELVQLAAIAASQNHVLRSQPSSPDDWAAERYWCISKARLQRWIHHIKWLQQQLHEPAVGGPLRLWREAEPILEEIFLSEVCTRVWCATLAVVDHHQLPGELDPIARSVFVGHLEARRRALRLLVFGSSLKSASTGPLNRLRQNCECWTDMLLANLAPARIARQFAFDTQRMNHVFAHGQFPIVAKGTSDRWSAQLVAMHFLLARRTLKPAVCPELNAQMGDAILSCLSARSFDACGILRPGWYLDPFQADRSAANVTTQLCGLPKLLRSGCNPSGSRRF